MILLGDSGSTKTDWRLLSGDQVLEQYSCMGLNPHFNSSESIHQEIEKMIPADTAAQIEADHFYGSGCSSAENKSCVEKGLARHFKQARLFVHHDLLAAARASSGREAALVGILGTGSNCCSYDGNEIVKTLRSGGYTLGDEGGGVNLGRMVLKAYVEEYLPADLVQAFEKRYQTDYDQILEALYKKEYPNRYMAQFSRFAFHHQKHPFVLELILENFRDFFRHKVVRLKTAELNRLNLVGSIAFYYHDLIRSVAEEFDVQIGTVIEKPISGLALYHLGQ